MNLAHVMAGVVVDGQGRILIAKRPTNAHQGGLWEFPGGKLETGEERLQGLCRELKEELGIKVQAAHPLIDIRHDYVDKSVRLDVWKVTTFSGEAHGAEGQPVRWVLPTELPNYDFPAANQPIVHAAQLPERYLITPELDEAALLHGLKQAKAQGIRLVQVRQNQLDGAVYQALASKILESYGQDFHFLFKGDTPPPLPNAGWHLTSAQLRRLWQANSHPLPRTLKGFIAASCHNAREIQMAMDLGLDFVTLSPVASTASHPDADPLGWDAAEQLMRTATLPVYLLGGMGAEHLERARNSGAQGIGGISALWPTL
ncbi:MAG: Nudix family hydrolase [Halopseudomonas sp.]|uniref:Nudix family hydrolase n=1 Tax=Halopseudomonas sp. TaxID=2901191 RepID=UPI0030018F25